MYRNVGYDPRKDFAPIGLIASAPALLLVHPSLQVRNVGELIALMKSSNPPFQVGTPGISTVNHLAVGAVRAAGRRRCAADSVQGLQAVDHRYVGGHVKVGFNPIPVSRARLEGKPDPRARGHVAAAFDRVPGSADRCRIGLARLRRGADLWAGGAGRNAASDHRAAQQGAARGARDRRGQEATASRKAPSRCRRRPRSMPR